MVPAKSSFIGTYRLNIADLRLIGLNRHISWILCRVLFDGIQQRPLLLAKVGRHLIINIGEELRKPVFWHPLGHLNGLQKLRKWANSFSCKNKCITETFPQHQYYITSCLTLFLSWDSWVSHHHPFPWTHFLYLETGSLAVRQCSISSAGLYLVESSDVEWWPTL